MSSARSKTRKSLPSKTEQQPELTEDDIQQYQGKSDKELKAMRTQLAKELKLANLIFISNLFNAIILMQ